MAQTVNTATAYTDYITATELLKRGDWRLFGDLCSDNNTRLASAAAVASDGNFLALLRDACAEIESACFVGGRYNALDLTALAANSGVGAGKLSRLIYRVTVALAYERRPDREVGQPEIVRKAEEQLQALRDGERIFSFTETMDAGRAEETRETTADVEDRGGLVYEMKRTFGRRVNRTDQSGTRED